MSKGIKFIRGRKKLIISFSILIVIFFITVVFTFGENTPMKKAYLSQVQTNLGQCTDINEKFTEKDIESLPEPVQRYFRYCGYIGKEKMSNAKLIWEDTNFKMSIDKPWFKIKYYQYNFVYKPGRIAYIYSKAYRILPFEGKDTYINGQGKMIGTLLKKITLFDIVGSEMNKSAAVTFLSECLIVPNCALQPYLRWEEIDPYHAKAILEHNDIRVEGIFTFNDKGEFTRFETDDRYMDTGKGTFEKHKWIVEVLNYTERNSIKIPSVMKGSWELPTGNYEYFNGTLSDIVFNNKYVE